MVIQTHNYSTPFGELIIGSFENKLCLCDWRYRRMREAIDSRIQTYLEAEYKEGESEVIENTKKQLFEYFAKERTDFDLPLLFVGTDFQKHVWDALLKVSYGTTKTYGELSQQMKSPDAVRAVAAANGANSISIIVPCHRIVGVGQKLVGYAGGLETKKKLLQLESNQLGQLELF